MAHSFNGNNGKELLAVMLSETQLLYKYVSYALCLYFWTK